jgi:hypothetical protein
MTRRIGKRLGYSVPVTDITRRIDRELRYEQKTKAIGQMPSIVPRESSDFRIRAATPFDLLHDQVVSKFSWHSREDLTDSPKRALVTHCEPDLTEGIPARFMQQSVLRFATEGSIVLDPCCNELLGHGLDGVR